jgi:hypothetical protein
LPAGRHDSVRTELDPGNRVKRTTTILTFHPAAASPCGGRIPSGGKPEATHMSGLPPILRRPERLWLVEQPWSIPRLTALERFMVEIRRRFSSDKKEYRSATAQQFGPQSARPPICRAPAYDQLAQRRLSSFPVGVLVFLAFQRSCRGFEQQG